MIKASHFIHSTLLHIQLHFICYSFLWFRQTLACRQTFADPVLGNNILNSWGGTGGVLYLSDLSRWLREEKKTIFPISTPERWVENETWLAFLLEPFDLEFSLIGCFTGKYAMSVLIPRLVDDEVWLVSISYVLLYNHFFCPSRFDQSPHLFLIGSKVVQIPARLKNFWYMTEVAFFPTSFPFQSLFLICCQNAKMNWAERSGYWRD